MSTSIQEQDLIQEIKELKQRLSDVERQQRTIGHQGGSVVSNPNSVIAISDIVGTPNARGIEIYKDKIRLTGSNPDGTIQGPDLDITWDNWASFITIPGLNAESAFRLFVGNIPATPTSAGTVGEFGANSTHLYVCVSTNTWRRVAIGTW